MTTAAARDRAVTWIGRHGDAFAAWRARVLAGSRSFAEVPLPDGVHQRDDGGFAVGSADAPTSFAALLHVVGALEDVGALHLPLVERACAAVEALQCADGGWDDGSDESGRLQLTGMLAGTFGRTRFAKAGMLAAAGDFLAERFAPERLQGFAWGAIAAHAHLFANVPHEASDAVLQWVGRELERGYRAGRFDAVRTARVLLYADAPSLPGGRVGSAELLVAILAEQAADGGWLRPEDPSLGARVEHSLDALTALTRFA